MGEKIEIVRNEESHLIPVREIKINKGYATVTFSEEATPPYKVNDILTFFYGFIGESIGFVIRGKATEITNQYLKLDVGEDYLNVHSN